MNGFGETFEQIKQLDKYGSSRQETLLETLKMRAAQLRSQLADIDAAIDALESNPDIAKLLETVAKVRY